jgi:putative ATP-dependent endonuclease of OLD family
MKLREIKIKNFRNLVDVEFPVDDTCVLIGENNSGKTAALEAVKIALTRGTGSRSTPFDEYDYHMSKMGDSPLTSAGISIELWFREDKTDEWSVSLVQALQEIIQTDPRNDIDSIGLRVSCIADPQTGLMTAKTEFLALNGQPLEGKGANPSNMNRFSSYLRLLALSALRDSSDEFSPRSQYWARILKDLKIGDEQRKTLSEELAKLNESLLKADPRLEQVRQSLAKVQSIMALGDGQKTTIQALPLKPWDLMSKSEVVIKPRGSEVDIPLFRHGQGIQSLTVLFLFQAFIDVLLKPSFEPETEAILTLEEPESHLHPQAVRALASNLNELKTQKLISTHSPYFIQEVPFKDIRLFRREGVLSKVLFLKEVFSVSLPAKPQLLDFCKNHADKYAFNSPTNTLEVRGKIEKQEYRDLLTLYPKEQDVQQNLKRLYEESSFYLSVDELRDLDTFARRIRGEILFARAWLLWEGQSEYPIIRYFGELMDIPFDSEGIAVIDYRNNGSAGAFVGLARALEFPWLIICDNDDQGRNSVKEVESRGVTTDEMKKQVRMLPGAGTDFEKFLFQNGFDKELIELVDESGKKLTAKPGEANFDEELLGILRTSKTHFAIGLVNKLRQSGAKKDRVPPLIASAIQDLISMVK